MNHTNSSQTATNPSAANAEVVRRGYHAFSTGDVQALLELFDEQASWHTPGQSGIAGEHRGRDAVFAQFGRYGGETGGTFTVALREVLAGVGGRVVGIHHNGGVRNGQRLDVDCCVEFEVRDGKIVRAREHFFDLHAWDQFWA